MRTLTALLTLCVIALAAGTSRTSEPVMVKEATVEGILFLLAPGGFLGFIKLIITGKRMR